MLKKEARFLGLSFTPARGNRRFAVSVVFRGRFWLDGLTMLLLKHENDGSTSAISRMIGKSRQYSQLHAVFVSKRYPATTRELSLAALSEILHPPVISHVNRSKEKAGKASLRYYDLMVHGKRISVFANKVTSEKLEEIFATACTRESSTPEVVRVADLIVQQVTLKWNSLGLA